MCAPCKLGTFSATGDKCKRCPANTFASASGRTACTPCPAGTASDASRAACGEWLCGSMRLWAACLCVCWQPAAVGCLLERVLAAWGQLLACRRSSHMGVSSCERAGRDHALPAVAAAVCLPGHVRASSPGSTPAIRRPCKPCPQGSISPGGSVATCTPCIAPLEPNADQSACIGEWQQAARPAFLMTSRQERGAGRAL